jgi:hypothetical protein
MMRTYLFGSLAMAGFLIAMAAVPGRQTPSPAIASAPTQELPPDIDESGFLAPLTPAEEELVLAYVRLMEREMEAHPNDYDQIRQKYTTLVRKALPPGKHLIARVRMGGC